MDLTAANVEWLARSEWAIPLSMPVSQYKEMRRTVAVRFASEKSWVEVTYLRKALRTIPQPTNPPKQEG